jgi:hypothetical protein
MKKQVVKRAVLCIYCGMKWDYIEGDDPQHLWSLAIEHEKACKKNPLVSRINGLLSVLKFISKAPADAPAKKITDYAKEMLGRDRILYATEFFPEPVVKTPRQKKHEG